MLNFSIYHWKDLSGIKLSFNQSRETIAYIKISLVGWHCQDGHVVIPGFVPVHRKDSRQPHRQDAPERLLEQEVKLKPCVRPKPPIITEAMTNCVRRVRRTSARWLHCTSQVHVAPCREVSSEPVILPVGGEPWGHRPPLHLCGNPCSFFAPKGSQGNPRAQPLEILLS